MNKSCTFSFCCLLKGERMKESIFQSKLIKDLKKTFKGSIVTKLDASSKQGIPDLLILYGDRWATLECKKSARAKRRPNQELYVNRMNKMSFSRFIFPENKEEVINELGSFFKSDRGTCDI